MQMPAAKGSDFQDPKNAGPLTLASPWPARVEWLPVSTLARKPNVRLSDKG